MNEKAKRTMFVSSPGNRHVPGPVRPGLRRHLLTGIYARLRAGVHLRLLIGRC
jgi:hypothetical protein